jgi:hypothetical chaperone protein
MPLLGKGGSYRSFDKVLEIPGGHFSDFADWSRLALMRNRKTLAELEKLRRAAVDPQPIETMIAVVEQELGYRLYEAVAQVKRDLSSAEAARFTFSGAGLSIKADVTRADFETWITPDIELFEDRFHRERLVTGNELTSIAHGLALIGEEEDIATWAA